MDAQKTVAKVTLTKLENSWYHYDVLLSDGSVEKIDGDSLRSDDAAAFIGWQIRTGRI